MPITPFHFGPGLFLKSIGPRWFSFTSFVATQVLIDLETLYNLANQHWPIHRFFHSIPGGMLAGFVAAGLLRCVRLWLPGPTRPPLVKAEFQWWPLLIGGILGGFTHSLLDAIFHSDVLIFYPVADGGLLHGLVGRGAIHWGCSILGLAGAVIVLARFPKGATS